MSKFFLSGATVVWFALAVGGCTIETCEQGAVCDKGDDSPDLPELGGESNVSSHDATEQCLGYCDRLSVCGAPQAENFDACVSACKVRFENVPEQTARLCACIPRSRCDDVVEGRCSDDSGTGGTSGSTGAGGSPNSGGSSSTGGSSSAGSHASGGTATIDTHSSSGGSQSTGGSGTNGGASGSGAAPAEAGSSCGAMSGGAGEASGETGGTGAGGESAGLACTCDCDCPEPQLCEAGYCSE
jgi:hypothetical protein